MNPRPDAPDLRVLRVLRVPGGIERLKVGVCMEVFKGSARNP